MTAPSRWAPVVVLIAALSVGSFACRAAPDPGGVARPTASPSPPPPEVEPSIGLDHQGPAEQNYRPRRPARVVFSFAPGVSGADRTFVSRTIRQARRSFRAVFGPVLRGTIRISVQVSLEETIASYARRLDFPEEFARKQWGSETAALTTRGPGNQAVQLYILVSRWAGSSSSQRAKLLFHEWFHVFQYQGPPPAFRPVDPDDAPRWLFEGSAEWWGFRAATEAGWFADFGAIAASERAMASGADGSLQSQREEVRGEAGYALAFTAVDLLAQRTGPRALVRFWKVLPDAPSPAAAFEEVFGLELRAFYREFAAYREAGFPG